MKKSSISYYFNLLSCKYNESLINYCRKFKNITLSCTEGASAAEYAIMASLIAAVIVSVVTSVGNKTLKNFTSLIF